MPIFCLWQGHYQSHYFGHEFKKRETCTLVWSDLSDPEFYAIQTEFIIVFWRHLKIENYSLEL